MCTGLEIAAMLGSAALSAGGSMIQQNEAQANAERQAQARNDKLKQTLARNDALAKDSREQFDQRQKQIQPDQMEADAKKATEERQATLDAATTEAPTPVGNASLSGSAPTVVKSELAKRVATAMGQAKEDARNLGKLGGYGDAWFNQGIEDTNVGRNLGQNANFASGNMAILPYQQDIAEQRAYKPISPIGGIMQGLGSVLGSYGGGGMVPKKSYVPVGSYV